MTRSRQPRKPAKKKGAGQPDQTTSPLPSEVSQPSEYGQSDDGKTISELAAHEKQERVSKYRRWIEQSLEVQEPFQTAYIQGMKILANDREGHWTAEALRELGSRPALVINHTTSTVMTVCGLQRRTRQMAKFLPGDPDDSDAVELLEYLYRWEYDQLQLREVDSDVFLKKYAGGIGFWKFSYDTSEDPRGRVCVEKVNPLNVLWDPNYPDCEWKDASYVIHAEWRTIDEACDEWPEHDNLIRHTTGEWIKHQNAGGSSMGDTQAPHRFFWDSETKRVRIAQVYYKRVKKAKVVLFVDGSVESDPEKVKMYEKAYEEDKEAAATMEIVRIPVTTIYLAHVLDQIELDHGPSPLPFKALGLFPSKGYHFWRRPVGAVEYMADPQREKNKRRSVITEIAGRAAHSGLMAEEGAIDPVEYEKFHNGAAALLTYKTGSQPPIPIVPPVLPQYLVYLEQQSTEDIPRVVNVTPELAGQPKAQVVSGRAINARQQSGQLSQEFFMDSFALDQAQVAKYIIEMVKSKVTIEEARRILGLLAERNNDEQLQGKLDRTPQDVLEKLLSRAFDARYDVVVTTEPWDPSGKIAAQRAVSDMFQSAPPPPIPSLQVAFHIMITELAIESGSLPSTVGKKWLEELNAAKTALQQAPAAPPGMPPGTGLPPDLAAGMGGTPPQ